MTFDSIEYTIGDTLTHQDSVFLKLEGRNLAGLKQLKEAYPVAAFLCDVTGDQPTQVYSQAITFNSDGEPLCEVKCSQTHSYLYFRLRIDEYNVVQVGSTGGVSFTCAQTPTLLTLSSSTFYSEESNQEFLYLTGTNLYSFVEQALCLFYSLDGTLFQTSKARLISSQKVKCQFVSLQPDTYEVKFQPN